MTIEQKTTDGDQVLHADLSTIYRDGIFYVQGRTARDRIAQWIQLKASNPSWGNAQCAEKMGIAVKTLNTIISRAVKDGWLKFEDPISRIEHEIVPKVVDNLAYFLDKKDRVVTVETAKGTIFKQYQESKGLNEAPQTVLALKIEPAPDGTSIAIAGQIVGSPRPIVGPEDLDET